MRVPIHRSFLNQGSSYGSETGHFRYELPGIRRRLRGQPDDQGRISGVRHGDRPPQIGMNFYLKYTFFSKKFFLVSINRTIFSKFAPPYGWPIDPPLQTINVNMLLQVQTNERSNTFKYRITIKTNKIIRRTRAGSVYRSSRSRRAAGGGGRNTSLGEGVRNRSRWDGAGQSESPHESLSDRPE